MRGTKYYVGMTRSVLAAIPARLDSTRFPAKMLANETGKPLIQYALEVAKAASCVDKVIIATDSEEIAACCEGLEVKFDLIVMTAEHANGTSRIAQAVQGVPSDLIVNLQGDEPELDPAVIDAVVSTIGDHPMATACCELLDDERDDENVVKVVLHGDGTAKDFTRHMPDEQAYRHLGLYVYQPEFLQKFIDLSPTEHERSRKLEQMRAIDHGYSIAVAKVDVQAGGIDTPQQYAEFVARHS